MLTRLLFIADRPPVNV